MVCINEGFLDPKKLEVSVQCLNVSCEVSKGDQRFYTADSLWNYLKSCELGSCFGLVVVCYD